MEPGERGLGYWPCIHRKELAAVRKRRAEIEEQRALVEFLREQSEEQALNAYALAHAAVTPSEPVPSLTIRFGIESAPELKWTAASHSELARLCDWLDNSPWAGIKGVLSGEHDD